jgi:hypothetical protein
MLMNALEYFKVHGKEIILIGEFLSADLKNEP